jgi:hypothetical protein
VIVGHDYAPKRAAAGAASVAEHRARNSHWKENPSEAEYRAVRDAILALPKLMLAASQINIRGWCQPIVI